MSHLLAKCDSVFATASQAVGVFGLVKTTTTKTSTRC